MKNRFTASLLLTLLLLPSILSSCGEKTPVDDNPTSAAVTSAAGQSEDAGYIYPELDLAGREFRILNVEPTWDFRTTIVPDVENGEALNDAIYMRNKNIEEKFNTALIEVLQPMGEIEAFIQRTILAGDDIFDVAFSPTAHNRTVGAAITEDLFVNLLDIETLNLDAGYWDQTVARDALVGSKDHLYFANNDINIMGIQGMWCMYFNENMIANLGLEKPYDLVRTGKWTLDRFGEYIKAGKSLNGDTDYTWDEKGKSIYGYTAPPAGTASLVIATGERYITIDKDSRPVFSLETERFFTAADKIVSQLFGADGNYIPCNEARPSLKAYDLVFLNGRAFFAAGELKSADVYRPMEDTFGIVPMPKLDENQENYYSMQFPQSPVMVIPATNKHVSETGAVMDALAYESNRSVTPVFYDITVKQKNLRNEESIEMLEIIKTSRFFDVGVAYDWTRTLSNSIRDSLDKGEASVASIIESNKSAVETAIKKTMDIMDK